jgi:hypothetical protein
MTDRIYEAIEKVATAPDIPVSDKVRLIDELRKGMPVINDRWTVRYIIWGLIFIAAVPILFFSVAAVRGTSISMPEPIVAIMSAAVGALATYLTPLRRAEEGGRSATDQPAPPPAGPNAAPPPAAPPANGGAV